MTREEAIIRLRRISNSLSKYCDVNDCIRGDCAKCYDALDMAIEALEQEPSCRNTRQVDLISRQAAIDVVRQYCIDNQIEDGDYHANGIEYELNELPTAQPFTEKQIQTMQELESAQVEKAYELGKADRPTGHWIETAQEYYEVINKKGGGVDENTPYFTDDIAFSECLAKFSVIDNETERFDFCPNCGADMRERGEG